MKIKIFILVVGVLFAGVVLAQIENLPNAGLAPDSPFYFLDTLGEKIGMFFTFSSEKKAEKALKYTEEKLAEVKVMTEKNKNKAAEKAVQKYQEFLNLAVQKGKNVENLATLIAERTLTHQEILQELLEKVPPEAQKGIERAIEASQNGFEEAIKAVSGEKKEELEKKAEEIKSKIEKENRRYPRTAELFEACARKSSPFVLGRGGFSLSEKGLEAILNPKNFEKILEEGITRKNILEFFKEPMLGMGAERVGYLFCRNNVMDKNLRNENSRLERWNDICNKNPSCCDLPEPLDVDSAVELIVKISDCETEYYNKGWNPSKGESQIQEMEKLEYGFSFTRRGPPYYLTDNGCLFDCLWPIAGLGLVETEELVIQESTEIKPSVQTKIKGDSTIRADLSQVRAIAEMIAADTNSYADLCEISDRTLNQRAPDPYGEHLTAIENDINVQGGSNTCHASAKSYCVSAPLVSPGAGYFCVDSNGRALTTSTNTCDAVNFNCL